MQEYTTVRLPTESVTVLEERVHNTEFESVTAYLTFLIEELSYQIESDEGGRVSDRDSGNGSAGHDQQPSESESESEMDEQAIERRLRSLGYLDVDG